MYDPLFELIARAAAPRRLRFILLLTVGAYTVQQVLPIFAEEVVRPLLKEFGLTLVSLLFP